MECSHRIASHRTVCVVSAREDGESHGAITLHPPATDTYAASAIASNASAPTDTIGIDSPNSSSACICARGGFSRVQKKGELHQSTFPFSFLRTVQLLMPMMMVIVEIMATCLSVDCFHTEVAKGHALNARGNAYRSAPRLDGVKRCP